MNTNLSINFLKHWIEIHLSSLTAWPTLLFLGSKSPCYSSMSLLMIWPLHIYMYIFQFIFLLVLLVSKDNENERRGDPCDDDWPLCCMQADRGMLLTALEVEEDLLRTYRNRITVVLCKGWVLKEPVAIKQCLEFFYRSTSLVYPQVGLHLDGVGWGLQRMLRIRFLSAVVQVVY